MRQFRISFILVPIVLAIAWACAESPPTAESPMTPIMLTGATCGGFYPTSAEIPIDSTQYFFRDSASISCGSAYAEITPATGIAGFIQGSACTRTHAQSAIKYAVRGCSTGSVILKVYNDSTKTTLLETITIDVGLL